MVALSFFLHAPELINHRGLKAIDTNSEVANQDGQLLHLMNHGASELIELFLEKALQLILVLLSGADPKLVTLCCLSLVDLELALERCHIGLNYKAALSKLYALVLYVFFDLRNLFEH